MSHCLPFFCPRLLQLFARSPGMPHTKPIVYEATATVCSCMGLSTICRRESALILLDGMALCLRECLYFSISR